MTITGPRVTTAPAEVDPRTEHSMPTRSTGMRVLGWVTSTDHKVVGQLYLIASFGFFVLAGLMALIMRAELAQPGLQVVQRDTYNQLVTMHGTIMMFLFATPLFAGFANVVMPLQLGA